MTVRINEVYDERYGEHGRYFKLSRNPEIYVNSDSITTAEVEEACDMNGDKFYLTHVTICVAGAVFNVYTGMIPEEIFKQIGEEK